MWFKARLAWRLLRDRRVPSMTKWIIPAGLLYALWPLDLIPAFIPILGQLDDLAALILAVLLFIRLCPPELVSEHTEAMRGEHRRKSQDVIEGQYKVLDDDT